MEFSPDSHRLVTGAKSDNAVIMWRTEDPDVNVRFHERLKERKPRRPNVAVLRASKNS